jgi:small multidrug resistance family-3 protein
MNALAWLIFTCAALLEVLGDAVIRQGLRTRSLYFIAVGALALGCYGLVVNSVRWDFSKLLGVYVGFFALISILFGRFVLNEDVPPSTWFGLTLIIIGGLVIQFGRR